MYCLVFLLILVADTYATQSYIRLEPSGTEFYAIDENILLIETSSQSTYHQCIYRCHELRLCRVLDYDPVSQRCRLFEGDIQTTGRVDHSDSVTSVVGVIELIAELFIFYGHTCDRCTDSRFLRCINSTCDCLEHTFWTGTVCASQKLRTAPCSNNNHCRVDHNLTCLQYFQCGPISLHNGTTIFGNSDGTAGNSSMTLNHPWGLTLTSSNALLIADPYNNRVIVTHQSLNASLTIISTGHASSPSKAIYDQNMTTLYILTAANGRLISITNGSSSGTIIFGSTSGSNLNQLYAPHSFAMDSQQNFFIADTMNHRILKFQLGTSNGVVVAGVSNTIGSDAIHLNRPTDVILDEIHENMYVADHNNHRILCFKFNQTHGIVVAGGNGPGIDRNQLRGPLGIYFSQKANALYVVDQLNHRLQRWVLGENQGVTIAGNPYGIVGNTSWTLNTPNNVVLDEDDGCLFISDRSNHRIQMFQLI